MAEGLTIRNGELRILDGSNEPDAANSNVEVFDADEGGGTFHDETSNLTADDSTGNTELLFEATADFVYVGLTSKFARIWAQITTAAVAAGALTVEYHQGSNVWASVGSSLNDGTTSTANTFVATGDYIISWDVPADWAVQGHASLDAAKYYVRLSAENVPGTLPVCDVLAPVISQYYKVLFTEGLSGAPLGRPRPEERIHMDRGVLTDDAFYTEGPDPMEPLDLPFSAELTTAIKTQLYLALTCGNPASTYWDATGTSVEGLTEPMNSQASPVLADASKKTVLVQAKWAASTGDVIAWEWADVYFPPESIELGEGEENVSMSVVGKIYGRIRPINDFDNGQFKTFQS